MHILSEPDLSNATGADVYVAAFLQMVGDLNLSEMWIVQRELNNGMSRILMGTIGVDVTFANLALEGLKPTVLDQLAMTVDCIP